MRREEFETARKRLVERRQELAGIIRRGDARIAQIRSEREIEFGDESQSEQEQTRIAQVDEAEAAELARVDAAIARIAEGSYGTCADCAEPIEPRRLLASPYAILCASCAGAGAAKP